MCLYRLPIAARVYYRVPIIITAAGWESFFPFSHDVASSSIDSIRLAPPVTRRQVERESLEIATIHLSRRERHFICHTLAEPSSGLRESLSPFPESKRKQREKEKGKGTRRRASEGWHSSPSLSNFDKVKIPRRGVRVSTPIVALRKLSNQILFSSSFSP